MMNRQRIKVLVVEDSNAMGTRLVNILGLDPQIHIIGTARNGPEALGFLTRGSPDVILMDIDMPDMDGFETTRGIMETRPVPIVICGDKADARGTFNTFRSMEAGAVAWVQKPMGKEGKNFDAAAAEMRQTVKLMSEVKVVKRWPVGRHRTAAFRPAAQSPPQANGNVEIIGIGASTGGPPVLQSILLGLPKDFPVPVLVVQHIAPGFLAGMAEWLNQTTESKVHVAMYGMLPLPGHIYLAPDDYHMGMGADRRIALSRTEAEFGLRPSVAHLFRSLAAVYARSAVGVLLTGMGKDGAQELGEMKSRGALTIAQDRETSVVHGMAGEAIALGGATCVLAADRIAAALVNAVNSRLSLTGVNHDGDGPND
jgi:two-component system chemotaxis response regulator CheB